MGGDPGLQGPRGYDGVQGPQGLAGPRGYQGEQGEPGSIAYDETLRNYIIDVCQSIMPDCSDVGEE